MGFKNYYLKENVEGFDLDFLGTLKTYNQRLVYCRSKLKKLGSGSSREVFEIDSDWVIKVAKNEKGIGQNEIESDYGVVSMYDFLPKIKEDDGEERFVIVERCEKINAKEFEKLTKIDFKFFCQFLSYYNLIEVQHKNVKFPENIDKELNDEDSFIFQIRDFLGTTDSLPGDFEKLSSFGKRDNKIKVIDWGFTRRVQKTYYSK
jgi:hypothetical protein